MLKRWFVFTGVLALAATAILMLPVPVLAQHHGGYGGHSGVNVGVGPGGVFVGTGRGYGYGPYNGGYYGSGWGNRWYGNGWNGGFAYPNYYGYSGNWYYPETYSYSYSPDYYNSQYQYPQNWNSAQGNFADYSAQPNMSGQFYGAPSYSIHQQQNPDSALITVRVPRDATIWFENHETKQKGLIRDFVSPALKRDQDFTYDIKAKWMQDGKDVTQTRHVTVRAGSHTNVDFLPNQQQQGMPAQQQNQGPSYYGAPGFEDQQEMQYEQFRNWEFENEQLRDRNRQNQPGTANPESPNQAGTERNRDQSGANRNLTPSTDQQNLPSSTERGNTAPPPNPTPRSTNPTNTAPGNTNPSSNPSGTPPKTGGPG